MSAESEQQELRMDLWDAFSNDTEIKAAQTHLNKVLDHEQEKYNNNPSVQQTKKKRDLIFKVHDEQVEATVIEWKIAVESKNQSAIEKCSQERRAILKDRDAIWTAFCDVHPDLVAEAEKALEIYTSHTSNARMQYRAVVEQKRVEQGIPAYPPNTRIIKFTLPDGPEWDY